MTDNTLKVETQLTAIASKEIESQVKAELSTPDPDNAKQIIEEATKLAGA